MNTRATITLNERQILVTELRRAGLTYVRIARQLGISPERVREIDMRARTRMRRNEKSANVP